MTPSLDASSLPYGPRDPSQTVLYRVVADHLETFLAALDADPDAKGLPAYVERELYDYLQCGVLAHGFLRLGCEQDDKGEGVRAENDCAVRRWSARKLHNIKEK